MREYQNVKGIIFDFDGTLYKKTGIAFRLVTEYIPDVFHILGERIVRRRFKGRDLSTSDEYYRAFFNDLGKIFLLTPEKARQWYLDEYMPRYAVILKKHFKPRKNVVEILARLDSPGSPFQAAIYSDYPLLKERMEAIGLSCPRRIRLYSSGSFGAQKPAARPFLQIASDLNLPAREILVIGDSRKTDGRGAQNAGMRYLHIGNWKKAAALLLS
ncbi:MAG: HAD family hydrolase [Treponema sp.]|nr:HAD family hydrolase [Treponema sp.]